MQGVYPILLADAKIAIWQKPDMDAPAFDPDLVRETMKLVGVTQKQMADDLGFPSQSAVSNLLKTNGKARKASATEAADIYRYLRLVPKPQFQLVPIIGLASAGSWQEAMTMPRYERPIPAGIAGPSAFGVEIVGDSMDKLLPEGGWAIVDPDQRELFKGRVYLIENEDHETTVKRFCSDPARFEPVSSNELHQPLQLHGHRFTVVGRVVSYGNDAGL